MSRLMTVRQVLITIVAWALLALALPGVAAAHGSTFTMQYVDGPNLVQVNQNVHDVVAGVAVDHQIRLYSVAEGQPVPFGLVDVTVTRGDRELARQDLAPGASGDANLTYSFPEAGLYTLGLSFTDGGREVAAARFPVLTTARTGAAGSGIGLAPALLLALASFVLGAATLQGFARPHLRAQPAGLERASGRAEQDTR